ncbi:MAG: aminotransferase class V-fold PLP-dependent enzyme [Eubacteriales bacterium]|nr:aminotransferase class V-fold PLP-dependent enzyme [Eubacteriales bacterium]
MKKVYLDNGSTSFPKAPNVGTVMKEYIDQVGCNVGRGGYESAYSLAERVLGTREKLCRFFGFDKESNVVFTPNITYSLNILANGLLHRGDHVIISSMEHNAIARPIEFAKQRGVSVSIAACDEKGRLDIKTLSDLVRPETKAVMMLHASNVCGTILPIEEIGKLCSEKGIFFVLDSAQTAGVLPINMKEMKIDALAFTGHKGLLGPQGIGGFLLSDQVSEAMSSVFQGGTGSHSDSLIMPEFLPDKFEIGTLNLPGILGLSAALDYVEEVGIDTIRKKELDLMKPFLQEMLEIDQVKVIGIPGLLGRTAILSLDFQGKDNAEIAYRLDDEYGIMTRCGLHCAPLAHQTLLTFPQGTIRFAIGHKNTEEEIEYAINAIRTLLK